MSGRARVGDSGSRVAGWVHEPVADVQAPARVRTLGGAPAGPWRALQLLGRLVAAPYVLLTGLVVASFAVRWALASAHVAPYYFPDEYIYWALAHGLAEDGAPVIRGATFPFPALLEPLLAAPFALVADPQTSLRLVQGLHALAMSLAAVPVYLLARRLDIGSRFALAAAALAVTSPNLLYAGFVTADAIAYPIALGAVYLGVTALADRTVKPQAGFVALCALAVAARVQYVLLPAAFVAAAFVVERGSVRRVLRSHGLPIVAFALPLAAVAVAGPARVLGSYRTFLNVGTHPADALPWIGLDILVLALAAGVVLVPAALVGLDLALSRPQSREEAAFAALAVFLGLPLLALAAFVGLHSDGRVQERYLFALLPLVALAAGVWSDRGAPRRRVVALAGAALAAAFLVVPLSGLADDDSPTLMALARFRELLANDAVIPAAAALLALGGAAVALRPRRGVPAALAASIAVTAALAAGAAAVDGGVAADVRKSRLPSDPAWIDATHLDGVALLHTPRAGRAPALQQLFWNRAVGQVLRLRGSQPVDGFHETPVRIDAGGRLLAGRRPIAAPILVAREPAHLEFAGARVERRTQAFTLWRASDRLRVVSLTVGRDTDGRLARTGSIALWPRAVGVTRGRLVLRLSVPARAGRPAKLRLVFGRRAREVVVRPGAGRRISIPVASRGRWRLTFALASARPTVHAAVPLFVPSRG
jgi:hypothetical protein